MKQALVKKGKVLATEVPSPKVSKGTVLIKVMNSCISAGTEMSSVSNSGKSIVKRAMEKPEHVKKVLDMVKDQGVNRTLKKVRGQLEGANATGYSISGVVIEVGESVSNFKVGDRVAAAGAGIANHAEFVNVPENLVMKMPNSLGFKEASTVTLGGIAMQGVRRADVRMGEYVAVVGMGILGLLAVQMLVKSGVRVLAIDLDKRRLEIAKKLGVEIAINPAEDPNYVKTVEAYTQGKGVDCVLFTAATGSSKPLSDSFKMCRRKGKVVLVGVVGMEIEREDIYAKELDFQISTSYGPGRYDDTYEVEGHDYPYAYVRWTENRNMTEYLRMLEQEQIVLDDFINEEYPIEQVDKAFESLSSSEIKPLMVILSYGDFDTTKLDSYKNSIRKVITNESYVVKKDVVNVAMVGAGGFATGMHIPNMQKLGSKYKLYAVVNRTGHKGVDISIKNEAKYTTTELQEVLQDKNVDLVMITTQHDTHAEMILQSLKAGKHVFVEKPLAVNQEELDRIKDFYNSEGDKPVLMVGFNRRFSKYAQEIKKHTDKRVNPLMIRYRMNAGYIPLDHWVHKHGGRMVGECCHIIDLMTYFTGSEVESISVESITPTTEAISEADNKSITLKYKDGSVATIEYFAVGSKKLAKENLEVHFDNKSILMDDYKSLEGYDIKVKSISDKISQKGQLEELEVLYDVLKGKKKDWPIELWDMVQTSEISFVL